MTVPVVIDCDPGIDDIMALLLAFANPTLDVRLITTVAGNQTVDQATANVKALITYLNYDIPIAKGASQPLFNELETASHVHGDNGLGGISFGDESSEVYAQSAIDAIKAVFEETDENIVVIATGPLTNIATFLLAYPLFKQRIAYISLMGGAAVGGNILPTVEFNMYTDPHAAQIVLNSGIPIVMSGLDVTHKAYMTLEEIEQIQKLNTDLSAKVTGMLHHYLQAAKQTPFHEPNYSKQVRLHDVCAVAYVNTPDIFKGQDCFVTMELSGDYTKGTTIVDYNGRFQKPSNVHVLYEVDRPRFIEQFQAAIRQLSSL